MALVDKTMDKLISDATHHMRSLNLYSNSKVKWANQKHIETQIIVAYLRGRLAGISHAKRCMILSEAVNGYYNQGIRNKLNDSLRNRHLATQKVKL